MRRALDSAIGSQTGHSFLSLPIAERDASTSSSAPSQLVEQFAQSWNQRGRMILIVFNLDERVII